MTEPTIQQRIEQYKVEPYEDYYVEEGQEDCYFIPKSELHALLRQVQDEQKEKMLAELESEPSKAQFDWDDAYYIIKNASYAHQPQEEG